VCPGQVKADEAREGCLRGALAGLGGKCERSAPAGGVVQIRRVRALIRELLCVHASSAGGGNGADSIELYAG
jgi:hypothetical protein